MEIPLESLSDERVRALRNLQMEAGIAGGISDLPDRNRESLLDAVAVSESRLEELLTLYER